MICCRIIRAKNKNKEKHRQMWKLQYRSVKGAQRKAALERPQVNIGLNATEERPRGDSWWARGAQQREKQIQRVCLRQEWALGWGWARGVGAEVRDIEGVGSRCQILEGNEVKHADDMPWYKSNTMVFIVLYIAHYSPNFKWIILHSFWWSETGSSSAELAQGHSWHSSQATC